MADLEFIFTAPLWLWNGKGAWHFVTVPADISGQIKLLTERRGFGSVPISAEINRHVWKTSLFPDSKSGCYLMPVKSDVRRNCRISVDDVITVQIYIDINS